MLGLVLKVRNTYCAPLQEQKIPSTVRSTQASNTSMNVSSVLYSSEQNSLCDSKKKRTNMKPYFAASYKLKVETVPLL